MDDAHIEELMWLEIDGTISPAERESLGVYLNAHPEARERLAALERMVVLFDRIGEVDPPPELHDRILRALEAATPPRSHKVGLAARAGAPEKRAGVFGGFAGLFSPHPAWRFAAAVAAGVVVGILGYHLIRTGMGPGGGDDNARFYGSMNKDSVREETMGPGGAILHIDVEGVTGEVTVCRDEARVYSELDIRSEREIEVTLDYDAPPVDISADEPSMLPGNGIAIREKGVRVTQLGAGTYRFSFALAKDAASPVTVSVRSEAGELLYRSEVLPPFRAGAGERSPEG